MTQADGIETGPLWVNRLKGLLPSLHEVLGENSEVVLHDLTHPEDSVVAIEGDLTHRKVGAPATDLLLYLLREGASAKDVVNYETRTAEGVVLRSSTLLLRDERHLPVASLCINIDTGIRSNSQGERSQGSDGERVEPEEGLMREVFSQDVGETMQALVESALRAVGASPYGLGKEQRLEVVRILDERGAFMVRGAVDYVAEQLEISRATLYNYRKALEEGDLSSTGKR